MSERHRSDHSKCEQQDRTDYGKRKITLDGNRLYRYRRHDRAHTDDDHQVKNIRSDDIADRKRILVRNRRSHGHSSFRKRGSHRNDRKSDDNGRNLEFLGDA